MGNDAQHVKLQLQDESGKSMQFLSFNAPDSCYVEVGDKVSVCFSPNINEWRGGVSVEGSILHLEAAT